MRYFSTGINCGFQRHSALCSWLLNHACLLGCLGFFFFNFIRTRVIWEKGTCWPVGMSVEYSLINGWCGRAQPSVDSAAPGQVFLGCVWSRLSKPRRANQWITLLNGLCFNVCLQGPALAFPRDELQSISYVDPSSSSCLGSERVSTATESKLKQLFLQFINNWIKFHLVNLSLCFDIDPYIFNKLQLGNSCLSFRIS